jgi:hypothetical protein
MKKILTEIFHNQKYRISDYIVGELYDNWEVKHISFTKSVIHSPRKFKIVELKSTNLAVIQYENKNICEFFGLNGLYKFVTPNRYREEILNNENYQYNE